MITESKEHFNVYQEIFSFVHLERSKIRLTSLNIHYQSQKVNFSLSFFSSGSNNNPNNAGEGQASE